MFVNRSSLQAAIFVCALAFTGKADITYNVSRTVGTGTIAGTIETDGTIATPLTAVNFLDWDLTMTIPSVGSYTLKGPLSGNNSVVFVSGADTTATANDLDFNFSGTDKGLLLFQTSLFSGSTYYCDGAASNFACDAGETIVPTNVFSAFQLNTPTGNVIIGTAGAAATPEPSFMTLTGLGFAALAFVAYRRRRRSQAVQQ